MKRSTGYVRFDKTRKLWMARISFTDAGGRRRERYAYRATRAAADLALADLRREVSAGTAADPEITFDALADRYAAAKLIPAEYVAGRKIVGRRELSAPRAWLKSLRAHFGRRLARSIAHADIEAYKRALLRRKTPGDGDRSAAAVNRELEFLRTILNWAATNRMIERNPFRDGPNLIDKSAEKKRDRWPTFGEEMAILAQCVGEGHRGREHLRAIVICLADTGLRKSELLTLDCADVDLAAGEIRLRAINAKTNRPRVVPMTARARAVLAPLATGTGRVFGVRDVGRSFATACRMAGVDDLHIHDLRHAFVTRGILAGVPQAMVLKASGHVSDDEWKRYLNVEPAQLRRLFDPLDGQDKAAVVAYGRDVLRGLKSALIADELADILADL